MKPKNKLFRCLTDQEITDLIRCTYEEAMAGNKDSKKLIMELLFQKPNPKDITHIDVNNNFAETKLNELQNRMRLK